MLFKNVLPKINVCSPNTNSRIQHFRFVIHRKFSTIPFLHFGPNKYTIGFLFFGKYNFGDLFFSLEHITTMPRPFGKAPFLKRRPNISFLIHLLTRTTDRFHFRNVRRLYIHFFQVETLPKLGIYDCHTFYDAKTGYYCNSRGGILCPRRTRIPLCSQVPHGLRAGEHLRYLVRTPKMVYLVPIKVA